jgi:predicted acetyltransferase
MSAVKLVEPAPVFLPGYIEALKAGWSPNTTRDVSGEQLAAIRADAGAFLRGLTQRDGGGTITLGDATVVPRLPGRVLWVWDGEFCGAINLRFVPGTLDLPPHVSGHVGYAIVPWKQRRGYATRALALMLSVAHGAGLPRLLVTCDAGNVASCRVIEANGGIAAGSAQHSDQSGGGKLLFWLATAA